MNYTVIKFAILMSLMMFFLIFSITTKNVLYSNVFAAFSIFISTYIFHYLLSRKNEKSKILSSKNEIKDFSFDEGNNKEVAI